MPWRNAAVGVIGEPQHPGNLMFLAVVAAAADRPLPLAATPGSTVLWLGAARLVGRATRRR